MRLLIVLCVFMIGSICRAQQPGNGVTDVDGNFYETVIIYGQEWMAQNLRVTKFNDGTSIIQISDSAEWADKGATPAWCYPNNNSFWDSISGKLYSINESALVSKKICPIGWEIPSYEEITNDWPFFPFDRDTAGKDFKEAGDMDNGTGYWYFPNSGTNTLQFNLRPSGYRHPVTGFKALTDTGEFKTQYGIFRVLRSNFIDGLFVPYDGDIIELISSPNGTGFPIRCVKSTTVGVGTLERERTLIFPNPVGERLSTSCSNCNYAIYFVSGQLVIAGTTTPEGYISWSGIKSGNYILSINEGLISIQKN